MKMLSKSQVAVCIAAALSLPAVMANSHVVECSEVQAPGTYKHVVAKAGEDCHIMGPDIVITGNMTLDSALDIDIRDIEVHGNVSITNATGPSVNLDGNTINGNVTATNNISQVLIGRNNTPTGPGKGNIVGGNITVSDNQSLNGGISISRNTVTGNLTYHNNQHDPLGNDEPQVRLNVVSGNITVTNSLAYLLLVLQNSVIGNITVKNNETTSSVEPFAGLIVVENNSQGNISVQSNTMAGTSAIGGLMAVAFNGPVGGNMTVKDNQTAGAFSLVELNFITSNLICKNNTALVTGVVFGPNSVDGNDNCLD